MSLLVDSYHKLHKTIIYCLKNKTKVDKVIFGEMFSDPLYQQDTSEKWEKAKLILCNGRIDWIKECHMIM
jgi:hypothetical protein